MLSGAAAYWLAKIPRMNLWALVKKILKVCEQTRLYLISHKLIWSVKLSELVHNLQYLFDNAHRFILGILANQHTSTQLNTYVLFRTLITTLSLSLTHSHTHTELTERVTQLYNVWNPVRVTNWYENVKLNSILSCKVCINIHSLEIVCWIICVYIQLPDSHMKDAMKTTTNVRYFQPFCEDRKQNVCFQTPVHLLH